MNPLSSFTWSTHQRIFSRYFLGSGTHCWVGSRSCPQRTGIRLGKGDAGNSESVHLARGEETEPSSLKSSRVALSHRRVCVCLCWESEAFVPGDQEGEGFEAEVGKTQKGWRCLKPHYPKYGLIPDWPNQTLHFNGMPEWFIPHYSLRSTGLEYIKTRDVTIRIKATESVPT